jgi:hypothetical protein
MPRIRLAALAAALSCALLLAAASGAAAQTGSGAQPATLTHVPSITGQTVSGSGRAATASKLRGSLAIRRYVARGGRLWAVGRLVGKLGGRSVSQTVRIPAVLGSGARTAQITPTPNACQVLNLTLQPLDLNLLGLRVRTSRIDVLIEAIPGPGNLLGNLLCAITGLLNPRTVASTPATQLARVLNALVALSPRTA